MSNLKCIALSAYKSNTYTIYLDVKRSNTQTQARARTQTQTHMRARARKQTPQGNGTGEKVLEKRQFFQNLSVSLFSERPSYFGSCRACYRGWSWGCSSVGRASERHAAGTGSIPRCGKGFFFFFQSQLSVQTLLRCPYTLVCNRMH